jgi:hypothetical protein
MYIYIYIYLFVEKKQKRKQTLPIDDEIGGVVTNKDDAIVVLKTTDENLLSLV